MTTVSEKGATRSFGSLADEDVLFLREQLESDSTEAASFFVDAATVEMLHGAGASSALIALLHDALRTRDGLEIELHDAPAFEGPPHMIDTDETAVAPASIMVPADVEPATTDRVEVGGRELHCVICGGGRFDHRRAQLTTALASFFDMDWMGRSADCYVCVECGYIHWFLR